jgi:aryl-alcohol dehydrogenase-like predicted oxidoreductase
VLRRAVEQGVNFIDTADSYGPTVSEELQQEGKIPPCRWPSRSARWSGCPKSRPLEEISREVGATPSQLALAWLLMRSPVMLPIPGTSSVSHLEDNLAAAAIELTDEQFERLAEAAA